MVDKIFEMVGERVEKGRIWEELVAMKTGTKVKTF